MCAEELQTAMCLLTDLSEYIADERFFQLGTHLNELKQVQSIAMFLHYHLEEELILICLQQLCVCVCVCVLSLYQTYLEYQVPTQLPRGGWSRLIPSVQRYVGTHRGSHAQKLVIVLRTVSA